MAPSEDAPDAVPDGAAPFVHRTVLRDEVLRAVAPKDGGVYLDVTLGGGGHAEAVLEACAPTGRLIGIDRDPIARTAAGERLARFGDRVTIVEATMSEARSVLDSLGISAVDGVVADLGVSSPQLDDASRGMSFRGEGPLDMRMDPTRGQTARELIDSLTERTLADLIYELGEERASRPIARSILRARDENKLDTTQDLAKAIYRVLGPPRRGGGVDPATRTFQALRIAVNDELGELDALLEALPSLLVDGGVAAIISFHSLEDRKVKWAFRGDERLEPLWKKPVEASDEEQRDNPRSRSAKLRAARHVRSVEDHT
ncbi:MAG: 16S rRNA (cytosine(1402)-N(4))-methyltransferase RsmH [Myxococcales bacterium]|nr:16S rRNA (cytosine(1402)-N(4))-methyltransferase RsmH [Myxococcales bacterium]